MNEHESGFLQFIAEPGRRRMQTLLGLGPKRRSDVRALLDHAIVLDDHLATRLEGKGTSAVQVEALLLGHGAPRTCYVISSDKKLDGREMLLRDALTDVVSSGFGAFVSCIPGRLGYFEYEDVRSAYLLHERR